MTDDVGVIVGYLAEPCADAGDDPAEGDVLLCLACVGPGYRKTPVYAHEHYPDLDVDDERCADCGGPLYAEENNDE